MLALQSPVKLDRASDLFLVGVTFGDAAHKPEGAKGVISPALVRTQFTTVLRLRNLSDGVEVYPGWREAVIVAQETPQASPLCGYLDGKPFYYWQRGEFGTYALWDTKQTQNCGRDLLVCAGELAAKEHKPCLIILRHQVSHPRCRFLKHFGGGTVGDETYFLYEWPEEGKDGAGDKKAAPQKGGQK